MCFLKFSIFHYSPVNFFLSSPVFFNPSFCNSENSYWTKVENSQKLVSRINKKRTHHKCNSDFRGLTLFFCQNIFVRKKVYQNRLCYQSIWINDSRTRKILYILKINDLLSKPLILTTAMFISVLFTQTWNSQNHFDLYIIYHFQNMFIIKEMTEFKTEIQKYATQFQGTMSVKSKSRLRADPRAGD